MKNIQYRYIPLAFLLLTSVLAYGQEAAKTVDPDFWKKAFGNLALLGGGIVIVGALWAIVRLFTIIMKMEELRILKEKGVEEIVEQFKQPQESWWAKLYKSMTLTVPVAQEKDIDLGHDYDGIRELDNKLPPWWLWMFYISIIFAVIYLGIYHLGSGPGLREEYEQDMETAKAAIAAYTAKQGDQIDENSVALLTAETDLALGNSIFQANCIACHGTAGEGNSIGPNLTDEYWLHGGGIKELFTTIKYGVIEKGMQSWQETLRPGDMQMVASYILSLQGSNPPNAKAPQGDLWKPVADETAQDTTQIGN